MTLRCRHGPSLRTRSRHYGRQLGRQPTGSSVSRTGVSGRRGG